MSTDEEVKWDDLSQEEQEEARQHSRCFECRSTPNECCCPPMGWEGIDEC